jgi:hypothetical protein
MGAEGEGERFDRMMFNRIIFHAEARRARRSILHGGNEGNEGAREEFCRKKAQNAQEEEEEGCEL